MDKLDSEVKKFVASSFDLYSNRLTMLATCVWLKVEDERVLALARSCHIILDDNHLPDWVRILANASDPKAVSDARDDLAQESGWEWLKNG